MNYHTMGLPCYLYILQYFSYADPALLAFVYEFQPVNCTEMGYALRLVEQQRVTITAEGTGRVL